MIALALSIVWVVWVHGYDFAASIEAPRNGQAIVMVKSCATTPCPSLEVHVQATLDGDPRSICREASIIVQGRRIFFDGFESGDVSAWRRAAARPDGVTRLLLAWDDCAGEVAVVMSAAGREEVRLDGACSGTTERVHAGDVEVYLGVARWGARLPAGRIRLGRLSRFAE